MSTTRQILSLFVISNTVRTDDGIIFGTFSSHTCAVCAYIRLATPGHAPLGGWGDNDLAEFHRMQERVSKWTSV